MNSIRYGICLSICLMQVTVYAVREFYNETNMPLFVAGYYVVADKDAERATDRIAILPGKQGLLDVPRKNLPKGLKRYIIVSRNENALLNAMKAQDIKSFPHKELTYPAPAHLQKFYFEEKDNRLVMLNQIEHSEFVKSFKAYTKQTSKDITEAFIDKASLPEVKNNIYKKEVAVVRATNTLPKGEIAVINKRIPRVEEAISKKFNIELVSRTPIISLVCSGGGYRAMLSTLGFMQGMQLTGVLDMAMYISALSGSTWFLGTWLTSKKNVSDFKTDLITRAEKQIGVLTAKEVGLISDAYKVKLAYDEPLTTIDLYGALLANMLFDNLGAKRHQVYLSQQADTIASGMWPFPIYNAVDGRKAAHKQYAWYELTPFEVGSPWLGHYVPTWGFGRQFKNGKSITDDPEIPLGFLYGIFGSAFSLSVERLWKEILASRTISNEMNTLVKEKIIDEVGDSRITMSKEHNFTVGMPSSPIRDDKYITMIDAGLDFNLPYPPVSGYKGRRQSDILIFFDASHTVAVAASQGNIKGSLQHLLNAEAYARQHGLKFPAIDIPTTMNTMIIFKDEKDPSVPLVIWFPLIDDQRLITTLTQQPQFKRFAHLRGFDVAQCIVKDFCNTFNFGYKKAQSEKLVDLCTFNVLANQDKLLAAIKWKLGRIK